MSGCQTPIETNKSWGYHASLDLYSCDSKIIRDAGMIINYVIKLCEIIDMKRYGDCSVIHFGDSEEVAGYSMVQLIETSSITGHFANKTNNAYLDIFSCKNYDKNIVCAFSRNYFRCLDAIINYRERP
jgi:S-adenosylmethionine/arginine decarboxylase-like enzyme